MSSLSASISKAFRNKWPNNNYTFRLAQHLKDNAGRLEHELHSRPGDIIQQIRAESQKRTSAVFELWEKLEEDMINVVYGSNMIEFAGSSLNITINLCRAIFRGQEISSDIDERDPEYEDNLKALLGMQRNSDKGAVIQSRKDVINHAKAMNYMVEHVILNNEDMSEDIIREAHRILSAGFDHEEVVPGEYRTHEVRVRYGDGKSAACMRAQAVPERMAQMIADLANDIAAANKSGELDPYTLVARYHQIFVYIHPFGDGNGRVSRLILNVLLLKYAGHICSIGMTDIEREEYLAVVSKGCKDFHNEDGDIAHAAQKSHFGLSKHVLDKSAQSLRGWVDWLKKI